MLAIVAVAGTLFTAGVVERAYALDEERAETVADVKTAIVSLDDAAQRSDYLEGSIEIAQDDTEDRAAVLAVRPAFVSEIAALGAALTKASGKVDTAASRASALSAQQTVLAENKDPAVVVTATATVHALADKVTADVAAWQAAEDARVAAEAARAAQASRSGRAPQTGGGGPAASSGGADGYARVRAALDRVGGAGVGLYESSSCAGGTAAACANSNGYIKYSPGIASWSTGRLNWAMAHELAHIYQFQVWGTLTSSGSYQSMFGGDPEFLANCMALVRGFPGSVGCNGDQQAWASAIWVGVVR